MITTPEPLSRFIILMSGRHASCLRVAKCDDDADDDDDNDDDRMLECVNLHINDSFMCSLDVNSLLTNVPSRETVDIICD